MFRSKATGQVKHYGGLDTQALISDYDPEMGIDFSIKEKNPRQKSSKDHRSEAATLHGLFCER